MEYPTQERGSRKGKGGPKTAEGKAKSALNAVTHGLTARAPVALWFETEEAWTTFRQGIVASLTPVGESEQDLAEKIALTLWRQNRVAAYETHRTNLALSGTPGEVERDLHPSHTEADAEARMRAKLTERLLLGEFELLKLQRYESHLGRELSRLFKHLHQLQDRRRAERRDASSGEPSVPSGSLLPVSAQVAANATPHQESAPVPIAPMRTPSPVTPFVAVNDAVPPAAVPRSAASPFLQNELAPSTMRLMRQPIGSCLFVPHGGGGERTYLSG